MPFSRAIQTVSAGQADFLILYPNPKVDALTWRAGVILESDNILLMRKDMDVADLVVEKRPVIGKMQTGFLNSVYENTPGFDFHFIQNYQQGIKLLRRSRIDALLAPEVAVAWELEQMKLSATAFAAPVKLNSLKAYLFVHKGYKDTEIGRRLVAAARQFYDARTARPIIDRFLPASWRKAN